MGKTNQVKTNYATRPSATVEADRKLLDLGFSEVWGYRELLYFFTWRDVKVRYKQTAIGAAWAIVQPLVTMVIFTVIFGRFARIPSDNLPYPIFAYTALLPWTYFASALAKSGTSLVTDANLITKVYFPRLMIPIAASAAPFVDFFLSFVILLGMMVWYGIPPSWHILTLPLFMALAWLTALAVGLWLSPINVRFRDIGHTIPFLTQIWMYASPVVYPVSMVPERFRLLYSLNPMAGVIEGFRWALLGKASPNLSVIMVSAAVVLALSISGTIFFRKVERTFADVI